MAVRLSACRADRTLTPRKIPGTHFGQEADSVRAIVRVERLGQLKTPITSTGIETATFHLVAQ
jgi:hypothetical protein